MPLSQSLEDMVSGVRRSDRASLSRAITIVESYHAEHEALAQNLLTELIPHTGNAFRIGITGPPGAGKSTLIDAFGMALIEQGHRVAVLAVDPTSAKSGGSILGDKSRMAALGNEPHAFVRPSPSRGAHGGLSWRTREVLLVCEAAGFDIVLVETVGVGQSETAISDVVDTVVVIASPLSGDELQGIKRGLLELADLVVINKADGELKTLAERSRSEFATAMRILRGRDSLWAPPVVVSSAVTGLGIDTIWEKVQEHQKALRAGGALGKKRKEQNVRWMWELVEEKLVHRIRENTSSRELALQLESDVREGKLAARSAALRLINAL